MIPGIAAKEGAKELQALPSQARTLYSDFIKWIESQDTEIKVGSIVDILYGSGVIPGLVDFVKTAVIIEKQISMYLDQLGADVEQAKLDTVNTELKLAEFFHLGGL